MKRFVLLLAIILAGVTVSADNIVKTVVDGETILASDWNAEFLNIYADVTHSIAGTWTFTKAGTPITITPGSAPSANTILFAINNTNGTNLWKIDYEADVTRAGTTTWTIDDSTTNAVTTFSTISHTSTGTATTSFGIREIYSLENGSGTNTAAMRRDVLWTDATAASEDADLVVSLIGGGSMAEAFRVKSTGNVSIPTGAAYQINGSNVLNAAGLMTPTPTSGTILRGNGTNWVATTATYPATAGSAFQFLRSDGTNFVLSTATIPATATGTGTILRADGTNWVATTNTYPTTTTANQVLYATGSNVIGSGSGLTYDGSTLGVTSVVNVSSGGSYQINSTSVLNATTLGSGVTASSLTSVGTLTALTVSAAPAFTVTDTVVNAPSDVLQIGHAKSSGTPTTGMGTSIRFGIPNASNAAIAAGYLDVVWSDATASSEDADLVYRAVAAGAAAAEKFRVTSTGTADITTGGTTHLKLGLNTSGTTYNAVSLNGVMTDSGQIGITGGGGTDKNLYIDVPTGGAFVFRANSVTFTQIDTGGHLVPGSDNTYNLGTAATGRWKDIFAVTKTSVLDVPWTASKTVLVAVTEGPEYRLYDTGTVVLDASGNGTVTFDPHFVQVTNLSMPWQATTSGAKVTAKTATGFTVKGDAGQSVDWIVSATRAGFENVRWRDPSDQEPRGLQDPWNAITDKSATNNTAKEPTRRTAERLPNFNTGGKIR